TFHSLCARILRKEAEHLGLSEHFSIYDTGDQTSVIQGIMRDMELDKDQWPMGPLLMSISNLKNSGEDLEAKEGADHREQIELRILRAYRKILTTNQALDFDDLLLKVLELFETHPSVLETYQQRFRHLLVDEYQDTNQVQYRLTRLLSQRSASITLTGDPDQSIYSWRGADISNILDFERDFPESTIVKLEQNYRSTASILKLANQVILHNRQRYPKDLWTESQEGKLPLLNLVASAEAEAELIADNVGRLRREGRSYGEMAIFYRVNVQSRSLEQVMNERGIPYRIVGGTKFLERMEVKDLIAYLRFISNPADGVSLMRIIDRPRRGIGETTKEKISAFAEDNGISLWEAMTNEDFLASQSRHGAEKLKLFNSLMARFFEHSFGSADAVLDRVMQESGLLEHYRDLKDDPEQERLANLGEFGVFVAEFCRKNPASGLVELMEHISLVSSGNDEDKQDMDRLTLMTLHAAKGLEFPIVFFAGLDEGILPHQRSIDAGGRLPIEEERRLCYVGITRAREELYLSSVRERYQFGRSSTYIPSRFISEMEGPNLEIERMGRRIIPMSVEEPRPRYSLKPAQGQRYRKGEPVRHERYGKGVILDIKGEGSHETARIFFDRIGEKKIMVEFEDMQSL
ncbi:MAG: UvrD-helicase domain-containing protein, partial [Planctomycetes bacterium]|nr:UvrD-helicase domain-containing protein [Planctomycetota bacterium]